MVEMLENRMRRVDVVGLWVYLSWGFLTSRMQDDEEQTVAERLPSTAVSSVSRSNAVKIQRQFEDD